jgi:hypothetical protein
MEHAAMNEEEVTAMAPESLYKDVPKDPWIANQGTISDEIYHIGY